MPAVIAAGIDMRPCTRDLDSRCDMTNTRRMLSVALSLLMGSSQLHAQIFKIEGRLGAPGQTARDRYFQIFSVTSGPARPLKSVSVISSDFNAYVIAVGPDGRVSADDNSEGGTNARLQFNSPSQGEWLIVVTSSGRRVDGNFTVVVDGQQPERAPNRSLPLAALSRIPPRRIHSPATIPARVDTVTVTRTDTVIRTRTDTVTKVEAVPALPWPPPQASAVFDITRVVLQRPGFTARKLGDISNRLESALSSRGYSRQAFYFIPGGFAIVTQLEQTDDDGKSLDEPNRWAMNLVPISKFDLGDYLAALFHGRPGHFRVIVIGVTATPFSQRTTPVKREEMVGLLGKGLNTLPSSIGDLPVSNQVRITGLVYEFELSDVNDTAKFFFPGRLSGEQHLKNSGLLASLRR